MNQKNRSRLFLLGAALCWALAGVCVKSITWSAMSLMCARSLLSFLVLALFQHRLLPRFTKGNLLGALMMTGTGLLYMSATKMTAAGTAIILQYIAPILVFLYSVLFRGRKAKPAELVLTLAIFGGIVLSFADNLDTTHVLGNLLALASSVTFAGQIVVMNRDEVDPGDSLMTSCILSFLITLPFLLTDGSVVFTSANVFWVLVLGIVQYGLANTLFGKGIHGVDPVESSLLLTVEPVANPIMVALVCGEMMGAKAIIGFTVVVIGVTLFTLLPSIEKTRNQKNTAAKA